MKIVIAFLFVVSIAADVNAQRGIRMSSRSSKRQTFITEGTRVFYECTNKDSGVGALHILNDSSIQVDTKVIRTDDLLRFSTRKRGAGIGAALFFAGGFLVTEGATTHKENGETVSDPALVTAGLLMTTAGLINCINRVPKKSSTWRFEVVH